MWLAAWARDQTLCLPVLDNSEILDLVLALLCQLIRMIGNERFLLISYYLMEMLLLQALLIDRISGTVTAADFNRCQVRKISGSAPLVQVKLGELSSSRLQ
jgi:hypothetical protein